MWTLHFVEIYILFNGCRAFTKLYIVVGSLWNVELQRIEILFCWRLLKYLMNESLHFPSCGEKNPEVCHTMLPQHVLHGFPFLWLAAVCYVIPLLLKKKQHTCSYQLKIIPLNVWRQLATLKKGAIKTCGASAHRNQDWIWFNDVIANTSGFREKPKTFHMKITHNKRYKTMGTRSFNIFNQFPCRVPSLRR
jgi:hypothetical protein